ncbi:MAG TPA: SDR family oxidoreductase [Candidatus Dormibacteraeota bacterium]|nr:SDR family oxidoreductase [Candidatus Dormibacteraeota bacterium]
MTGWTGVEGKRVVITGATSGIGLAAVEELAARGARLTLVARSEPKANALAERIEGAGGKDVDVVIADFSSQADVRRAAAEILARRSTLDALVNNAGVYLTTRQVTTDGIEMTWAVNHLAPFLLTNLLLERLKESAHARVVTTASDAHVGANMPFDDMDGTAAYAKRSMAGPGFIRYGQTKLANVLFTAELARRLEGTGVTANCFHPGLVATGITRELGGMARITMRVADAFSRRPQKGAETLVWLVDSPEVADISGGYFVDKRRAVPAPLAQDVEVARRLWEVSEAQTRVSAELGR